MEMMHVRAEIARDSVTDCEALAAQIRSELQQRGLSAKDQRWFSALLEKTLKLRRNFLVKSERLAGLLAGAAAGRSR
jgi:hypothetical protein